MQNLKFSLIWGWLGLAGFLFTGCEKPAPTEPAQDAHSHEHGDHDHEHGHSHEGEHGDEAQPESYAAAVQQLVDLQTKFRDALAKDDKDAADGPIHEFGHVLESVESLAKKAALSEDDQAAVKTAVDKLFEDIGKVDAKIHGDEGVSYSEVESQVDEALATLKKYVPAEM